MPNLVAYCPDDGVISAFRRSQLPVIGAIGIYYIKACRFSEQGEVFCKPTEYVTNRILSPANPSDWADHWGVAGFSSVEVVSGVAAGV